MKSKNYKSILLFISITILATISLQIYWNIKNYAENERRLINDVQLAFDNSIEHYYAEDVKNDFVAYIGNDSVKDPDFIKKFIADSIFIKTISRNKKIKPAKSFFATSTYIEETSDRNNETEKKTVKPDVSFSSTTFSEKAKSVTKISEIDPNKISEVRVLTGKKAVDSISNIKNFANKILISMMRDSIEFDKIEKSLDKELARKDIQIDYGIQHLKSDTLFDSFKMTKIFPLKTFSNSTLIPQNQKLELLFSNPTILILKRSMTEIVLSLLLSLSIIFCLLYLLKTINRQKKIDEIKNDLISNITHEFKTPITTVSTAIEGLRNFNDVNDVVKTKRYLDISSDQLKKLEVMVEKLLETASIDTDKLVLEKEKANLIVLLKNLVEKHKMICPQKTILFDSEMEQLMITADVFHLENAISNLIDNAVKYGGEIISIRLNFAKNKTEIYVEDNGNSIEKSQRDKIFDKFYRIPKGNIHDIKGFGIGLFYSKKIIEKHDGTLELISSHLTTFKITLSDV